MPQSFWGLRALDSQFRWCFPGGVAILATLGTTGWGGIFYQGSFPKPLPKEAQPARQLVRLCLLDGRWLRWARTPLGCPAILLTLLLLAFGWGDGLVADNPPLRQVVPVYRLRVAGETFWRLTWPDLSCKVYVIVIKLMFSFFFCDLNFFIWILNFAFLNFTGILWFAGY